MQRHSLHLVLLLLLLLAGCSTTNSLRHQSGQTEQYASDVNTPATRHIIRGAFHESMNDPRRAVYEYNLALLHDSTSVEIRRALAENYLKLGEYESFVKHALAVLASEPYNRKLRSQLLIVHHHLGEPTAAIRQINLLLEQVPFEDGDEREVDEEMLLGMLLELHTVQSDTSSFLKVMHDFLQRGYVPSYEMLDLYHDVIQSQRIVDREIKFLQKIIKKKTTLFTCN